MNSYALNDDLPPAYLDLVGSDGDFSSANELYEDHKTIVNSESNTLMGRLQLSGLASIPTWSPAARVTICPSAPGGGFSD